MKKSGENDIPQFSFGNPKNPMKNYADDKTEGL